MPKQGQVIHVTAEILERAAAKSSDHCPVAEAVKEQVPGASFVSVDLQSIRWTRDGRRYIVLTPPRCQLCIIEFDQGRLVEPFTSRLIPAQIIRSGKTVKRAAGTPRQRTSRPGDAPAKLSDKPTGAKRLARPANGSDQSVPIVVGGHAPKVMSRQAHAPGRRREFGLRALER